MWDMRTTDLWIRELNSDQSVKRSWNILSDPTIPVIPESPGYDNVRVDIRLKNVSQLIGLWIRTEAQTVGSPGGTPQGLLIVTNPQSFLLNEEHVFYHWFPMWSQAVDLRLWVRLQQALGAGCNWNCPDCITAPPWNDPPTCGRVELYDFAGRSRHLTHINLGTVPVGYTVTVQVRDQVSGAALQAALVELT